MMFKNFKILMITAKYIFSLFLLLLSFNSFSACLNNGDSVSLSGILTVKSFQGPNDSGDGTKTYKRWVLQLDKPFDCVTDVDTSFPGWNQIVTATPPDSGPYKNFEGLLNKHVNITGPMILAATAYNFTSVLLMTRNVELTNSQ